MRVADPGINQPLIELNSLLGIFVPRLIARIGVEFVSTVCGGNHMQNSFIPSISQLDGAPAGLIQNCLPHVFVTVCGAIHNTSITNYNCGSIKRLGNFDENILELHLKFH